MEKLQSVRGTKIDKARIVSLEKGKLPPQALDLEEAVLGAMMIDKKGIDTVIDILHPEAFYDKRHQEIYTAIYAFFQNSEPIDLLSAALKDNKEALVAVLKKEGKKEAIRTRLISQLIDPILVKIVIAVKDEEGVFINQSRRDII